MTAAKLDARASSLVRAASSARRMPGDRPQVGRYDQRTHNTRLPATGLARPPASSRNSDVVVAAVEDPWGDGKQRVFATVNRRVDILEMERSHRRISETAYRAGRTLQGVFEKLGRVHGSNWSEESRGDAATARNDVLERSLDRAKTIQALMERIRGRIGMVDTRLLRRLLGDRMSFADCAALQGKSGERGERYVAMRFRDALEELGEAWAAKGKVQPAPADKHVEAAASMERPGKLN